MVLLILIALAQLVVMILLLDVVLEQITRQEIERATAEQSVRRALVQFYEDTFEGDGQLLSLFEVVEHNAEANRRRAGGRRPRLKRAVPGDASTFVDDTIPHGTLMQPGEIFAKTWRIRNSGSVPWLGRQLERQGPLTGPGLITSQRYLPLSDTQPGEIAEVTAPLKAPTYDCTSIAYFKMADEHGNLCFPDNYQLGLDVLVMVRGQMPDKPVDSEV